LKKDFRRRIEFGGKAPDIVTGDFGFAAAVPHADCRVVEEWILTSSRRLQTWRQGVPALATAKFAL
jgi:hypothetical protein